MDKNEQIRPTMSIYEEIDKKISEANSKNQLFKNYILNAAIQKMGFEFKDFASYAEWTKKNVTMVTNVNSMSRDGIIHENCLINGVEIYAETKYMYPVEKNGRYHIVVPELRTIDLSTIKIAG